MFDALTMERPYRAALSRDVAFEVLADEASKGWRDRVLVDAFVNVASSGFGQAGRERESDEFQSLQGWPRP